MADDSPSQGFVQVRLPDRRRGGLLGQASVLTVTANGVDTSSVVRGAWLLENILGAPPSPPPPNIPVIEPDTRGTTTQRERLQKHRDNPSCLGCHRQIDPPGFALESFDAIGGWRAHYQVNDKVLPVDPSGEFGGTAFKDVGGFKEVLLQRQPQFARCLVEKLLIHALGRELTPADRPPSGTSSTARRRESACCGTSSSCAARAVCWLRNRGSSMTFLSLKKASCAAALATCVLAAPSAPAVEEVKKPVDWSVAVKTLNALTPGLATE